MLATGRQPLGAGGEVIVEVPPLDLPETDEPATVAASDAVTLLMMRAEAAGAGFAIGESNAADVARIARRLDGLPLALELSAVRLRVFGSRRLADLLDDRFAVLVSSIRPAPPRHQTLRAAVTWSYDLLGDDEKGLFRALSVLEGGFDLSAAQRVAGTDLVISLLPALVERSMVVVDRRDGNTRYRLLETLREYGRAHLDPDEAHESRRSHLAYFVELAEKAGQAVRGPLRLESLARLDADRNNLRIALNWALTHGDHTTAVRLAAALNPYWDEVGQFSEGASWLRDALAGSDEVAAELRARAHEGIALMAIGRGEHEHAERSARLARSRSCATRATGGAWRRSCTASARSNWVERTGSAPGPLLRQSLELRRELGDHSGVAECLEGFAALDERGGDPISAVRLLAAADALRTRTGSARPSSDDRAIADRLRALRAVVGDEVFDAAWRTGHDLDPDVVAAAMQDPGPDGPAAPRPFPPRRHHTGTAMGDNGGRGP